MKICIFLKPNYILGMIKKYIKLTENLNGNEIYLFQDEIGEPKVSLL
jgi:hypothetical protein